MIMTRTILKRFNIDTKQEHKKLYAALDSYSRDSQGKLILNREWIDITKYDQFQIFNLIGF